MRPNTLTQATKRWSFFIGILAVLLITPQFSQAQMDVQFLGDLETGGIFGGYNSIQIYTDEGTQFDAFGDQFRKPVQPFVRLRLGLTLAKRHTIIGLYAPLTFRSSTDGYNEDILFQNTVFDAGVPFDVRYKFNSYRLTYRFHIVEKERITFAMGLTGKIREAAIELKSAQETSINTNLGFVPIINIYLNYKPIDRLAIIFEGDALVAPQGRAEDLFLGVSYYVTDKLAIKAGYRILEGGGANPESTAFSMIHYASLGMTWGM